MSNGYTKFNTSGFIRDLVNGLTGDAFLTTAQVVDAFNKAKSGVEEKAIKQALNSLVTNRAIGKTLDGSGFVSAANGYSAAERKAAKAASKPAVQPREKKARATAAAKPAKYTDTQFVEYFTERLGTPSAAPAPGEDIGHAAVLYKGHDLTPDGLLSRATTRYGREPQTWYVVDDGKSPVRIGLL